MYSCIYIYIYLYTHGKRFSALLTVCKHLGKYSAKVTVGHFKWWLCEMWEWGRCLSSHWKPRELRKHSSWWPLGWLYFTDMIHSAGHFEIIFPIWKREWSKKSFCQLTFKTNKENMRWYVCSLSLYIYTHTYMYICTYICIYIHIHVTITKKPQWKFPNLLKIFNSILGML